MSYIILLLSICFLEVFTLETYASPQKNVIFFKLKDKDGFFLVKDKKLARTKEENNASNFQYIPKSMKSGILVNANTSCIKNIKNNFSLVDCNLKSLFSDEFLFAVKFKT